MAWRACDWRRVGPTARWAARTPAAERRLPSIVTFPLHQIRARDAGKKRIARWRDAVTVADGRGCAASGVPAPSLLSRPGPAAVRTSSVSPACRVSRHRPVYVVMVAPECAPVAKAGGLGDVTAASAISSSHRAWVARRFFGPRIWDGRSTTSPERCTGKRSSVPAPWRRRP